MCKIKLSSKQQEIASLKDGAILDYVQVPVVARQEYLLSV